MAIFYDRICGAKGENNSIYWTYIMFPNGADTDKVPRIYGGFNRITSDLKTAASSSQITDYGRIIVEEGEDLNQKIKGPITLNDITTDSLTLNDLISFKYAKIYINGQNENRKLKITWLDSSNDTDPSILLSKTGGLEFTSNSYSFSSSAGHPQSFMAMNSTESGTAESIKFWDGRFTITQDKFSGEDNNTTIEAGSFNATSDARAKTNLIELPFSDALRFVNSTPVYTFIYKDSDTPSIGVLAQDLLKNTWFVNNFSLVDNVSAAGENGDYMSVKESKLVYVLWRAVQELSKQINTLRDEIASLKN